ncbi:MAG: UDP-glucose/GDP-mannose dehydrogenase family protein [Fervidicoccaceae archaeon]|nr:UDP-glucose/GDP-mannose dehydrogenase family protein [Fervidicoccaceae archaeon]
MFRATTDSYEVVLSSDISFICVGTPSRPDGSADLSYVESAARSIGRALRDKKGWHLVVVRSTVPPGTTGGIVRRIIEEESGKRAGVDFGLCMNPEFTREGSAVEDTFTPDRIVIGELDERSGAFLEKLYRDFHGSNMPPIIRTSLTNAELIKYASNAFLAMKVSFINEIANIAQRVPEADVEIIARGIGLDKRIGPLFLRAGLGFGGSCFPKDLRALIRFSESVGYEPKIIRAVMEVNESQPYRALELAKSLLGSLEGKRIAVLGLAFKPNTDDVREAVSIKIVKALLSEGASVVVYDPKAMPNARRVLGETVVYAGSAEECLRGADCAIVVTEWDEFRKLRPEDFSRLMRTPVVVDGRRIYDPKEYSRKLKYAAIGLGPFETSR